ncbi:MAG: class I SAM-dependent methyltransferase [Candidatus Omnitrophota bacterium]|nr:MAG: class I SAM-dependent methyltransferase [Candidatus Omnitrophota bacterium]
MQKLKEILDLIYKSDPLQEKRLKKHLNNSGDVFLRQAEQFACEYSNYLESQKIPLNDAVTAYLKLCHDILRYQIKFMKTGKYPVEESQAPEFIYNDERKMKSYIIGLAISQFLWETHYFMYNFFSERIKIYSPHIKDYLEVGPGHGLFLNKALEYLNNNAKVVVVDISPISINITKSIVEYFGRAKDISYHTCDILNFNTEKKFDFITIGEVLEHVKTPAQLLDKIRKLLKPKGRVYISTCVNAPAIDHVYHFKTVDEIREMIRESEFSIETEHVLPVEDLPMQDIEQRRITINYCAILKRTNNA